MQAANIPVQLSEFVIHNRLTNTFKVYLHLKAINDKINRVDLPITGTKKTFLKHLKKLLKLNWIGYNENARVYHVRGFDAVRKLEGFKKRRAVKFGFTDTGNLQTFLAASVICSAIQDQNYYKRKIAGAAAKKKGVARQRPLFPYNALSNYKIAKLLGCKQTRATVIKNRAIKLNYLRTIKHYRHQSDDSNYRKFLYDQKPHEAARMRLIQGKVFRQLPDEIIPKMIFKRRISVQEKK